MSGKSSLRIDWCSPAAARYACEHWHYSENLPPGRAIYLGAWEDGTFVGTTVVGQGANKNLLKPYGLFRHEGAELKRVALKEHSFPVTRFISIALKMIKKAFPSFRLIISFADINAGHAGIIYQAGNWVYKGIALSRPKWKTPAGEVVSSREVSKTGVIVTYSRSRSGYRFDQCERIEQLPKHRYLYPLDEEMRIWIGPSAPYPKTISAGSVASDVPGDQPGEGGAIPTPALQ